MKVLLKATLLNSISCLSIFLINIIVSPSLEICGCYADKPDLPVEGPLLIGCQPHNRPGNPQISPLRFSAMGIGA
jgi:hypothetical protein